MNSHGLRKMTFHTLLLWLTVTENPKYASRVYRNRCEWTTEFLSAYSFEYLTELLDRAQVLENNPRALGGLQLAIERELKIYRALPETILVAEPRRIGVGYRDKGSLRPHHKVPMGGTERWIIYMKDVEYLIFNLPTTDYLTAEEVQELDTNPDHVLLFRQQLAFMEEYEVLGCQKQEGNMVS
jgi:hypothetical protein